MGLFGKKQYSFPRRIKQNILHGWMDGWMDGWKTNALVASAATNAGNGEGVAVKKVTNVFSKKILAKRALREIKLLQHFRGMLVD